MSPRPSKLSAAVARVLPAFRVDDVAVVIGGSSDERLRAAARACPAGAVLLSDADTGEEVDP